MTSFKNYLILLLRKSYGSRSIGEYYYFVVQQTDRQTDNNMTTTNLSIILLHFHLHITSRLSLVLLVTRYVSVSVE